MEMCKVSDLFEVEYGSNLELNKLKKVKSGINFVSRYSKNNGVSAIVEEISEENPLEAGLITVALGSNGVMSSFVQPTKFYSGRDVAVLTPKSEMTLEEKIFYCICLKKNRYRYSYGRQANKTIRDILIPKIPYEWVSNIKNTKLGHIKDSWSNLSYSDCSDKIIDTSKWKEFSYSELFEIKKGKRIVKSKQSEKGNCPFVSSTSKNNGVSDWLNIEPNQDGNTISVNYDGSIGEAFYHPIPYWALDSVNVLYPKFELNVYIAMFLITIIKKEKYRYNYGRKWHSERMENSFIKLPVDINGEPNWSFMEDFIKGLPYSKCLESVNEQELIKEATTSILNAKKSQRTLTDF